MATKLPQLNTTLKPEWRITLDQIEAERGFGDQAIVKAMFHALHQRWISRRDWPPAFSLEQELHAAEDPAQYYLAKPSKPKPSKP